MELHFLHGLINQLIGGSVGGFEGFMDFSTHSPNTKKQGSCKLTLGQPRFFRWEVLLEGQSLSPRLQIS